MSVQGARLLSLLFAGACGLLLLLVEREESPAKAAGGFTWMSVGLYDAVPMVPRTWNRSRNDRSTACRCTSPYSAATAAFICAAAVPMAC